MRQTLVALLLLAVSQTIAAFQPRATRTFARTTSTQALWAKKKKRSVLGEVAASGGVVPRTRQKPRKASNTKKGSEGAVSPALAEWASSSSTTVSSSADDVPTTTTGTPEKEEEEPVDDADKFERFKKQDTKKSSRRVKQSARMQQEEERHAAITAILDNLNEVLDEKKNSLEEILAAIRPILSCETGNLRSLTNAGNKQQYNYRLAWVGSDDALCHIGTGLHKVPLARMQEVFLTLQGKGRVEILEVISVLGPFPNVRNTLQGDSQVTRSGEDSAVATEWEIVMDSMIDGTGKEIPAGTDDNIRRAKLQVYFCDANAILAVMPSEESNDDPLQDNGANALLFVREDDLGAKLDMLRVS